jgi:hypothetical protein
MRATTSNGPWTIVGSDIDDTRIQYRGLFADDSAETGKRYYYRVLARNRAGSSPASNVVGPVQIDEKTIVDELSDYSRSSSHSNDLSVQTANPRPYKEDAHRLKGREGSWIVYRTAGPLRSVKVLTFMETTQKDFEFYTSADGSSFSRVDPKVSPFPTVVNPYGYKLPVQYELNNLPANQYFMKIVYKTEAQVSRIEVRFK